jgi:hypothetical protein
MRPARCAPGRTTAASRWMVRYASRAPTGPGSSGCCGIARVRPSRWSICTSAMPERLVYRNPKPVRGTAPGARPSALVLTPLELITKIAALVPPPRAHRHRYYGVRAPNAPLRSVVTALAPAAVPPAPTSAATREELHHRAVARYLWAMPMEKYSERRLMADRTQWSRAATGCRNSVAAIRWRTWRCQHKCPGPGRPSGF